MCKTAIMKYADFAGWFDVFVMKEEFCYINDKRRSMRVSRYLLKL